MHTTESQDLTPIQRAVRAAGSQEKLATMLGVTQSRVSQWCNGGTVHHRHYTKIETATGVTSLELLQAELAKLEPKRQPPRRRSA